MTGPSLADLLRDYLREAAAALARGEEATIYATAHLQAAVSILTVAAPQAADILREHIAAAGRETVDLAQQLQASATS